MINAISNILRKVTRKEEEPLNILCYPVHEANQCCLARTGHNFYMLQGENLKDWNEKYRAIPPNFHPLPRNPKPTEKPFEFPPHIDFDLIMSENKMAHFDLTYKLSRYYNIPILSLEHTLPPPNWGPKQLEHFKRMRGETNVFITDFNRQAWGWSKDEAEVIYHGVETDLFCPNPDIKREKHALVVANLYRDRNWCLWYDAYAYVRQSVPTILVGDNPGESEPAGSVENLIKKYQSARVFLNTSVISPIPRSLLEAAACGCAIVTTSTCDIKHFFSHGKNCYFADHPEVMKTMILRLLDKEDEAKRIGEAARQMILEKCSMERYTKEWNDILRKTAKCEVKYV